MIQYAILVHEITLYDMILSLSYRISKHFPNLLDVRQSFHTAVYLRAMDVNVYSWCGMCLIDEVINMVEYQRDC